MIQIYVCEDNPEQLEYFSKTIKDFLLVHGFCQEFVYGTGSPEDLLGHLKAKPPEYGLYFLDICLGTGINGLQLAREIRKFAPLGEIVFITSKSELCMLTFQYQVRALDFIVKDDVELLQAKILKCMKTTDCVYRQILGTSSRAFYIKQRGERIFLNPDEVFSVETSGESSHKLVIYTKSKVYQTYGTIKEFEAKLSQYSDFVKCHQSVLVNKKYIQTVDKKKKQIVLCNGSICPASVRYLRNGDLAEV